MCGICGFIGKGDRDDLKKMNDAMLYRGPEEEGLFSDDTKHVFLGHRRLSIIDISTGQQPMWSHDRKLCIVFNGEIYNHIELRNELIKSGHIFLTDHSDTEVLLNGYKQWGENMPCHLNGMWAFAIYDTNAKTLFLSRDRFGKKPLFYSFQNNNFFFASELSSLVQHKFIKASISSGSLKKYFAYGYIPAPNSLYENIFKLKGGYNLEVNIENLTNKIYKYWEFKIEPFKIIPRNPIEEWGEQLRFLLDQAVKRRLIADVPLGVFLSGGVDSSSITYFAKKHIPDHLKTFSIGFKEATFDESYYSDKMSKLIGTDHHLEILSLEKARELIPEILAMLDEPMGDSSLLPTYMLCKETKKYVTVAVGGDGADELFSGYDPFKALAFAKLYKSFVPKPIHSAITTLVSTMPVSYVNMSLDFRLKRTLRGLWYHPEYWLSVWMGTLAPSALEALFNEPSDLEDIYSEAIEAWDSCKQQNLYDKTSEYYTKLYLQDDILVKVDRASMMNTLEVRAPFLDIDLVNFVRQIPYNYKYRNGVTKFILKKSLEGIIPEEILYRPKKGFGVPISQWYKDKELTIDTQNKIKFLNPDFLEKQLIKHQQGENDNRAYLWNHWILLNMGKLKNL